ncbi:cAMP-induced filamentation protein [Helicobacter sp. CLO-3]|uniref:Fic family protein n=1 Tax=unclassified Helicobacter TaxID=2593540 RepID=UPI000804C29B|nr:MULTISPECIES: Fic family protein [unclassified Helicobacter]OBV29724.1 cAMP-induced filamentation protein [Helicobacter sp. CLO-3]OHU82838.1 cAMP-induced filamentation protein [Helicobacter sp. CLO-3]
MPNQILQCLLDEKSNPYKKGLYHYTQIHFAYHSNRIEGSTLSKEQTRCIYEKDSFLADENQIIKSNDIYEMQNHFKAFDYVLDSVFEPITEDYVKKLHAIIKQNCSDISVIGDYKKRQNFIADTKTTPPQSVSKEMKALLKMQNLTNIEDIIDFHYRFESIHPFEDGNGRVGRLLMFKQCLSANIIPFIIDYERRFFYYRGLKEYAREKGYLIDTCLACQDDYGELILDFGVDLQSAE